LAGLSKEPLLSSTTGDNSPTESADYGDDAHWQDTIRLLRLVQSDYQGVRKQLETVSHTLAGRESLVNQRLEYALRLTTGYRTLCLASSNSGFQGNQIGKTILGEIPTPGTLPKLIRLNVRCLGRFEVHSEWRRVERWQSVKAKSLLAYLMTRPGEPVAREVLMEALWPDCDPQAAGNNLKAAMHGLRQTLNRLFNTTESYPYVLFLQGSYLINPEIDLWVDVEEFEKHRETGRRLEREERTSEAMQEYESAEALYRGDYLNDEPYEDWTLLRREALNDTYVTILGKLADHAIDTTDYESGIIYCQKILAKDRCREDAYRRLMRCYCRLGQRNRALRWYEICRQTIRTELDTDPDHETTHLYHQLLEDSLI
jgi:DNA-binding SARP family transcriptional activator